MNKSKRLSAILCFILILYLTSCSSKQVIKSPSPVPSQSTQMQTRLPTEYRIQPGDELEIKLFDQPELNEIVPVRPDGRISVQLAHEIMAANRTPAELTDLLTEKYDTELQEPRVTVIVRSFSTQKVYVGGEVKKPQVIVLEGITTVLQAVLQAGGLMDTARKEEVVLIRRQADYTPFSMALNLARVIDGTDMNHDIVLMPYDIVFVPKSPIADLNLWVEQYIRRLLPLDTKANFSYRFDDK